jgi:hypothetical protein
VYCSSQELSEQAIDKYIASAVGKVLPAETSLTVYGNAQLADLVVRFPATLEAHYRADLQTLEERLRPTQNPDEEIRTRGLRLAMLTFGSGEGATLRRAVSENAVLDALLKLGTGTPSELAKHLSDALHLPRALPGTFVEQVLEALMKEGLVTAGERWSLTPTGRDRLNTIPAAAAKALLDGQHTVRGQLTERTRRPCRCGSRSAS